MKKRKPTYVSTYTNEMEVYKKKERDGERERENSLDVTHW